MLTCGAQTRDEQLILPVKKRKVFSFAHTMLIAHDSCLFFG